MDRYLFKEKIIIKNLKKLIKRKDFEAEFNEDLNGYVIVFDSGHVANTQFEVETNKLHADYGEEYLVRYTDYDSKLSSREEKQVEEFVKEINSLI